MKYWHGGLNACKWFLLLFTDKRQCPIFRLGDIVRLAQGNFTKLSIKGGVIGVYITWNCDLDWSFDDYCLPTYSFRILDTFGWNFRHAHYHEENRRTLVKAYGLKFLVVVDGRASKFDLKNTVIVLVTGLGLLGLSTMFCDFILLNYSTDRRRVRLIFIFQKEWSIAHWKSNSAVLDLPKYKSNIVVTFIFMYILLSYWLSQSKSLYIHLVPT